MPREFSRRTVLKSGIATALGGGLTGNAVGGETDDSRPVADLDSIETTATDSHPMWGVDPARTGHNPETTAPTEGVQLAWSVDSVEGSPIVAGEQVYDSSGNGYDTKTGEKVWKISEYSVSDSIPAVADGTIYYHFDQNFGGFDINTQSNTWDIEIGYGRGTGRPAAVGESVYFISRMGREDDILYALDADTGDIQWSLNEADLGGLYSEHFAVDNSKIYVTLDFRADSEIRALNTDRGIEQWRTEYENAGFITGPAVSNGIICAVFDWDVVALDANDGTNLWSTTTDIEHRTVAVDRETVYSGGGSFDERGWIAAYDIETGEEQWRFGTDGIGLVGTKPTIASDTVYVGANDGAVYALNSETGDLRWKYEFRTAVERGVAVADGWVYVTTEAETLYALRDETAGPPSVGEFEEPPTDPDQDGLYEDVNGDGEFTVADAQAFHNSRGESAIQDNSGAFDFNGNGNLSEVDVQALFDEYLRSR